MLAKALTNESEDIRYWSVRSLGKIGRPALHNLLEVKKHPNNRMRLFAVYALAEIGSEIVMNPLIECLGDQSWPVRNAASEALHSMGKGAITSLIKAIGSDNDDISFWAQKVLANFGDAAVQSLIDALDDKKDKKDKTWGKKSDEDKDRDYMRKYAIVALGKIGTKASLKPLLEILESEDVDECETVVESLGDIKNPELVERLLEFIASVESESVVTWMAKILTNIGDVGKPVFFKSLRHPSKEVRFWVIKVLGTFTGTDVLRAILFALKDPEPDIRVQAILALDEFDESPLEAVPFLVKMVNDPEFPVRLETYKVLGKIGEEKSINMMIERYIQESEVNRAEIIEAFQQIESSNLMVSLLKSLRVTEVEQIQTAIVGIVERICDSPVKRDLLVKQLDPDEETSAIWGIKILSKFEDESVVNGILNLLSSESENVVTAATVGLVSYLTSGNFVIRDNVSNSLTELGTKIIKPLLSTMDSGDDFMKMNVFQVIENMGEEILPVLEELAGDKGTTYYSSALELYSSLQRSSTISAKKQWKPKPKEDDTKKSDSELEDIMAKMKLK
jgi:HEAT repeat protein